MRFRILLGLLYATNPSRAYRTPIDYLPLPLPVSLLHHYNTRLALEKSFLTRERPRYPFPVERENEGL